MSTLVIKANSTIANPQYGKIFDLLDGQRFALDARNLKLANGAAVSEWTSPTGTGAVNERRFDSKYSTYNFPVYKKTASNGLPSVTFNGNEMLTNTNDNLHFVHGATYAVVIHIKEFNPDRAGWSRIFGADLSDDTSSIGISGLSDKQQHEVFPANGKLSLRVGAEFTGDSPALKGAITAIDAMAVGVFVFNGSDSRFVFANTVINEASVTETSFPSKPYNDLILLGGSSVGGSPNGSALKADFSYIAQYEKGMSASEVVSLTNYLISEFDVA